MIETLLSLSTTFARSLHRICRVNRVLICKHVVELLCHARYIKSCDWGDCLRKTHLIDKQKRGPAPPSKFPREIVALFEPACATYMAARSHPNFVPQVAVNAVRTVQTAFAILRSCVVATLRQPRSGVRCRSHDHLLGGVIEKYEPRFFVASGFAVY